MQRRDILVMEAELQRHTLRATMASLRRHHPAGVARLTGNGLAALLVGRLVSGLLGRRASQLVYLWLGVQTARRLFFGGTPRRDRKPSQRSAGHAH